MNNRNKNKKHAFTLVELLMVVVIISMMAVLTLFAVNSSINSAKESKTRGTIQKLDAALQEILEQYQDRYDNILKECNNPGAAAMLGQRGLIQLKQHLMYDLMRMEMPSHWFEVVKDDDKGVVVPPIPFKPNINLTVKVPPVFAYYKQAADKIQANGGDLNEGSAELLYLIIANLNPEALANFRGAEIGDINGNGICEFHDGWGRPIQFIRFAPAITDTVRQPDIVRLSKSNSSPPPGIYLPLDPDTLDWEKIGDWWKSPLGFDPKEYPQPDENYENMPKAYQKAMIQMTDPFDPSMKLQRSWFLYPLIYSAGADGKYDIDIGRKDSNRNILSPNSAETLNPFNYPAGMPRDNNDSGALHHYDNITNHQQQ